MDNISSLLINLKVSSSKTKKMVGNCFKISSETFAFACEKQAHRPAELMCPEKVEKA